MLKLSASLATRVLLSTILGLLSVACSDREGFAPWGDRTTTNDQENAHPLTTAPSTASASPDVAPPISADVDITKLDSTQPRYYELGLDKADSAWSNSQSAHSQSDWHVVTTQWQDAIVLLQAVPANSPDRAAAQTKITEYQRQLNYAQRQATRPTQNSDNLATLSPQTLSTSRVPNPTSDLTPSTESSSKMVFQAPIKRLAGGTPVIEVTFNHNQQIEMIVDTGASKTVITRETATALGVVPVAQVKANTANAKAVEFPIGYVNSISVDGAEIVHLSVAIAPSAQLEVGLLGHDFLGNFDLTIKRDVVEFRPR